MCLCYEGDTDFDSYSERDIQQISTNGINVLGVTSVDDELFVLLWQDSDQIAVYSIGDYQLQRHINLPGLKLHSLSDLTSCSQDKWLYVSDYYSRCVHRHVLTIRAKNAIIRRLVSRATTSKWAVPGSPRGLSMTPNWTLLVTCQEPSQLVELSPDKGLLFRQIALQPDIVEPWHGIKLTSGHYVVCHHSCNSPHRLCIVDYDGTVTRIYDDQSCESEGSQLNWSRHLAAHKHSQLIYVADHYSARVMVLSPRLEFVGIISDGLSSPDRLYFDDKWRRLYVGQLSGSVVVIQQ